VATMASVPDRRDAVKNSGSRCQHPANLPRGEAKSLKRFAGIDRAVPLRC